MNTVIFFVENNTDEVVFITMSETHFKPTLVLKAIRGAYKGKDVLVDFWETCKPEEVEKYFTSDYQLYKYDWENPVDAAVRDDSDPAWNDESGIMWEIMPVQKWAKNETITSSELEPISEWLGLGVGYSVADFAVDFRGELPDLVELPESYSQTTQKSTNPNDSTFKCPGCNKVQERRFNVFRTNLDELAETCLSLEDPIVWADGAWQGQGDDEGKIVPLPNEHDDAVLVCGNCGCLFLQSDVIYREPNAELRNYMHDYSQSSDLPTYRVGDSANWIRTANLNESMIYLAGSLAHASLINWSQWTAAQQVIAFASEEVRSGHTLNETTLVEIKKLIGQFLVRINQMMEGTLGALDSYGSRAVPNAASLDLEFYEAIEMPGLANMQRIMGDTNPYSTIQADTDRAFWVATRLKLIKTLANQENHDIVGSAEVSAQ